jgi:hypothetical protein
MNNIISFEEYLNEDLVNEAARKRTAAEVNKESMDRIKQQMTRYAELMKSKPEKANVYKALLDLAHARMAVVTAKQKVDALRESVDFEEDLD